MHASHLARLRRLLALRGLTPAVAIPEAGGWPVESPGIHPARLVEEASLGWHPVGAAEPWPDPLAFLDGVQTLDLVGYHGAVPIFVGQIAAAVRERRDGRLRTVVEDHRRLAIARPDALAATGDLFTGFATVALREDEPRHPARDLALAARALDRARGALELEVGARYRAGADAWLLVDGSLSESPVWALDPRVVAVSKSHATLPFEGPDLERYLRLPAGQRTSVFEPQSRSVAPVLAWALRLWPWEDRDLFHGLVRIEVAPANGRPAIADQLCRRLLAERAPLSTPDPRWDRLLYGMYSVGQYLRARGPVPA